MAVQLAVPIEVFEAVIDQATDCTESLRRLSLACRVFLPRTRYHLFSSIVVRSVQHMDAFCAFLDSHSWAPPLVRKMTLAMALNYDPCTPTMRLLDVAPTHLLSRLPNLRAWRMEVAENDCGPKGQPVLLSPHRAALSCYERHGGRIQHLELSNVCFDDVADFKALVLAFAGVYSLSCSHIRFRTTTEAHEGASADAAITHSPRLKRLHLGTFVDMGAVEYLLGSSRETLEDLVLTVSDYPRTRDSFERLEKAMSQLLQIASLTLVISCGRLLSAERDDTQAISQDIRRVTKILGCISRSRLWNVQVEFELHHMASLGRALSWGGPALEACNACEDVLLTFPHCRITLHPTAASCRIGRSAFWYSIIKRAFPKLDECRLLSFNCPNLNTQDPPSGHEARVTCLVASRDSKSIVSASMDGTIIVWEAARATIAQEWLAHQGSVDALAWSPDSLRLVSASGVGSEALVVWDIANNDGVHKIAAPEGHTPPVTSCAWSPDGALLASASVDGTVRVWDALTFQQRDLVDDPRCVAQPRLLQFSPDSRCLAWISSSPTHGHGCNIWRPLAGDQPLTIPSHPSRIPKGHVTIYAFSFGPESARIATAHGYSHGPSRELDVVRIWDVATGTALAILQGHAGPVVDVAFSPDGASLLSVSSDSSVKIWDVGRGEETASFQEGPGRRAISHACFSPDGKYVATASWGKTVRVWRLEDASCAVMFSEHKGAVRHVAFSQDGEFLASGDDDGVEIIWYLNSPAAKSLRPGIIDTISIIQGLTPTINANTEERK
ncbi:transporter [Ganoderma sinense ZZ0214-1]|uniref:Transporter n=1 Tax=Ganoderma sinense ZZ0214-1 TaxID=1077348 RepID=A0A2G8S4X3_9APHY|nr:transporter [Ganoderma sinense ZZ0214-1]